MPRRTTDSRTLSAIQLPRRMPAPLEEDITGRLRRLEEKRSSRPPPIRVAARAVPFEQLLRDFVSEISRKRGIIPP